MFVNVYIFVVYHRHYTHKQKQIMKQDIRLDLNFKYGNIVYLHNVPCNVRESIVNNNMNKMFNSDIFVSDDIHK